MEEKLGVKYTEGRKTEFAKSYRESGPASPVFFILSPGVDPLKDVESLGTITMHKLHAVTQIHTQDLHNSAYPWWGLRQAMVLYITNNVTIE